METDENFKVREAKLCEINSKFNIIIDLLIRKGMISKEEVSKMIEELSEEECKDFIIALLLAVD